MISFSSLLPKEEGLQIEILSRVTSIQPQTTGLRVSHSLRSCTKPCDAKPASFLESQEGHRIKLRYLLVPPSFHGEMAY